MSDAVILTGGGPEAEVIWAVGHGDQLREQGRAPSFADVPDAVREAVRLTIVLPGDLSATRRLRLPLKREQALEAAARLAFEDILAEPVDTFHFAFGPLESDGQRLVAAAPRVWFEGFVEAVSDAGLVPDVITLDHLVLAVEGHDAVILLGGHRAVAALPQGGMTVGREVFDMLLPTLEDGEAPLVVAIGGTPSFGVRGDSPLILADERSLGAFLLSCLGYREPASFLRGEYRPRRDWSADRRRYGRAAALVATCFVLWLMTIAVDAIRYDRQATALAAASALAFSEAFPNQPIVDLDRQLPRARAPRAQGDGFLPLSVALTEAFAEMEAVTVTSLRYTPEGQLVADLVFPTAAAFETVQDRLEEAGLVTEETGSLRRNDDGAYIGQLAVRGGRA